MKQAHFALSGTQPYPLPLAFCAPLRETSPISHDSGAPIAKQTQFSDPRGPRLRETPTDVVQRNALRARQQKTGA